MASKLIVNEIEHTDGAGTAVTIANLGGFRTVSSSNPLITSNPSAIGHYWINSTSGEAYICTNATTNLNLWHRVGSVTGSIPIEYLLVGGGGGGGSDNGGGGGGGAVVKPNATIDITASTNYSISIGTAGAGGPGVDASGTKGVDTTGFSQTAGGGGAGMTSLSSGTFTSTHGSFAQDGVNGGGGAGVDDGASGIGLGRPGNSNSSFSSLVFIYDGKDGGAGDGGSPYYAGGGAGSNEDGDDSSTTGVNAGGDGGNGVQSAITGTNLYWAAGGGGGINYSSSSDTAGDGGLGGGGGGSTNSGSGAAAGAGGTSAKNSGSNGTVGGGGGGAGANTGSGGGGAGRSMNPGGNGATGIIVIAYLQALGGPLLSIDSSIVVNGGSAGTIVEDTSSRSGYRVYQITAGSGNISW